MTNKAGEQPTITQSDREKADMAFDLAFSGDTETIDHDMAELFASHRTTSLAAQDGLVEALERCAQIVEQWNHRQNEKVDDIKYIVRNALSAIKGDKS